MTRFTTRHISRLATALVGLLPQRTARCFGARLGTYASYLCRRRTHNAQRNMGRVLDADEDLQKAGQEVFKYYGQYWGELLWLQAHATQVDSIPTVLDGIEELRNARAANRGMILAMPHLGSWEVLGFLARKENFEISVVADTIPEGRLQNWFLKLRTVLGMELMDSGRKGVPITALAKKLRTGSAVVMICDRDLTGSGVPVVFFGEDTTLPAEPATLAELTGAPIFPAAAYFLPDGGHRLVINKPLAPTTTGSLEHRLRLRTQRLAQALEELIRQAPTQWHLVRRNWPSDR